MVVRDDFAFPLSWKETVTVNFAYLVPRGSVYEVLTAATTGTFFAGVATFGVATFGAAGTFGITIFAGICVFGTDEAFAACPRKPLVEISAPARTTRVSFLPRVI